MDFDQQNFIRFQLPSRFSPHWLSIFGLPTIQSCPDCLMLSLRCFSVLNSYQTCIIMYYMVTQLRQHLSLDTHYNNITGYCDYSFALLHHGFCILLCLLLCLMHFRLTVIMNRAGLDWLCRGCYMLYDTMLEMLQFISMCAGHCTL